MNIALISPSQNAYSETFIQAHKNLLKGNIFFYYGQKSGLKLEGQGSLNRTLFNNWFKIKRKIYGRPYEYYYDQLFKQSLLENKIDVVLAEYGPTANKFLQVIRELRLPLLVHFHGYDATSSSIVRENNHYQEVFRYSDSVIAVSKKMMKDLQQMGCDPEKIIYNPCAPADDFLKVKCSFSKKQFVAVGRFVNKKAPYYTILAFQGVLKEFPDAQLIMAGNGVLLDVCKNLAKYFGMDKNVKFTGVISPEEFRQYLTESIGFVQHSVTAENGDSEGTPVGVLEASAAGIPVLSTNHGGIPDVIIDGKTGLLVNEHDISGMMSNMTELLRNPELAREMGNAGKENVRNNFTTQRSIATLNFLLAKAVSS